MTATTARTVAVVSAGLSQPSSTRLLADRLGVATVRALRERGTDARLEVVEVRDLAREVTNALLTGVPGDDLRRALDTVTAADGLVAVTPVFAASYSGLFKAFFDAVEQDALAGTPVLVAATGGTERHSLVLDHAMRPLFSYLRSPVMPTGVYAASTDWGAPAGTSDALAARIARAAGELADAVQGRPAARPVDPFEEPTPFADLLARRTDS